MLLAININNTETKVGLFRGESLESHWRLTTAPQRTADEWASTLTSYLAQAGRSTQEVRAAIVASVVPPVTQGLCEAVERATTVAPAVVDGRSQLPITLDVEEPLQVGADRILNTLAAAQLFHRDTIVVDFGTATTFDCITADGHFLGGVIMPGIRTASDALIRGTAKLPATAGAIGCSRGTCSPTCCTCARPNGPSWRRIRCWGTCWRWASAARYAVRGCPRRSAHSSCGSCS